MSLCYCGQFPVPSCCGVYMEDAMGRLRHTETVCYEYLDKDPFARPLPEAVRRFEKECASGKRVVVGCDHELHSEDQGVLPPLR